MALDKPKMADDVQLARRREIRRRKILENSVDRLRRLANWESPKHDNSIAKIERDERSNPIANDRLARKPILNGTDSSSVRLRTPNANNPPVRAPPLAHAEDDEDSDDGYIPMDVASQSNSSCNIRTLPKILTENKACTKAKVVETLRPLSRPDYVLWALDILSWRKGLTVFLAIFLRLLLCVIGETPLNIHNLMPLMVFEIFLFTVEALLDKEHVRQPQGILAALLLLLGVRDGVRIAHTCNVVMRIIEDFSVFFFAFFMSHWWIEAIIC